MTEAVHVRLPVLFAGLFPDAPRRLDLTAGSVRELVDKLDGLWPGMRDRICDSTPAIRQHMNIFVKGQRVQLEAKLEPGSVVFVLTAVSGG